MRVVALALFAVVATTGCEGGVPSSKVVRNGETWFSVSCGRMSACYDEATRVCPGTYKEDKEAARPHELLFTCTSGKVHWRE